VNVVREIRMHAGLTQALLAQVSGVSVASIGRYESGRMSPTLDVLSRLTSSVGLAVEINLVDRRDRDLESDRSDSEESRPVIERATPDPSDGIWTF
jgi:transcriptional regulator with XRE-family HTH domain